MTTVKGVGFIRLYDGVRPGLALPRTMWVLWRMLRRFDTGHCRLRPPAAPTTDEAQPLDIPQSSTRSCPES